MPDRKFHMDLPIPPLNPLQRELVGLILRIEELARREEAKSTDADDGLIAAATSLSDAMDRATKPMDPETGRRLDEHDYDAWAAVEAVEKWILHEASGTGSARVMAICYLSKAMVLGIDYVDCWQGTLDDSRIAMTKAMLNTWPATGLPDRFWRIFWDYREALVREMRLQNLRKT